MSDPLTIFGAVAVLSMVVTYVFVLLFSLSCLAASLYAFMQGAWPFGVAEMVWSVVAARRWQQRATVAAS